MLRITGFSLILFSVVLHSLAYASSSRDSGSDPFLGSVNPYSVSTRGDEFGSLSDLNQDSPEICSVGNWPFGNPYSVVVDSTRDLLFCGSGGGVFIYDVSDPANQLLVSEGIHTYGPAVIEMSYDEESQRLYIAADYDHLEIWDVQNPENPIKLGSCEVPGDARSVTVSGNYAYVISIHLRIIDVSDPSNPLETGFFIMDEDYNQDVAVSGDYAYLTDSGQIRIIDVSDPYNPIEVNTINDAVSGDIKITGNHMYVCNGDEIGIYELTTPANPVIISSTDLGYGYLGSMDVVGNLAVFSDSYTGLLVVDITSLSEPVVTGVYEVDERVEDVSLLGTAAFLAADHDGTISVDVTDPGNPMEYWTEYLPTVTWEVAVDDTYAYLANCRGIYVIDVSDPSDSYETGKWTSTFWICTLALSGNYVFAEEVGGGESILRVIDVSQHENPIEIGSYNPPGLIKDIACYDSYVFLAMGDSGIEIVDVSILQAQIKYPLCQSAQVLI